MSDIELIEQLRRGERIRRDQAVYSMYDEHDRTKPKHFCDGRIIVCCSKDDTDISECRICGRQWLHGCTFDEDCS